MGAGCRRGEGEEQEQREGKKGDRVVNTESGLDPHHQKHRQKGGRREKSERSGVEIRDFPSP